ncbi:MAG: TIR domain-containing protein [Lachnospiraceae bacterium]|nr:TIR domain-containing protein [Lachnospiraceae bacterium]
MTLFISYAHREALICRLIVYALKARGHKVWFDETNIPHGSDWRSEILKGIERSSGVLSVLSRDAVKPGGVCLDELSIAVGVRGGNIRTVLIEQDVTPPPTIMSRQWLDLTEWQKFRNLGVEDESLLKNPEFIKWFGEKIHLLIEMLETRENREFEGQITAIKKALPALYFATSRQMFLLKEYYVERTWMREKVESWLDDPQGESVCIIYGDPGIGKSAFSAHYAHYNGRVATAIFCEKGQNALNSPEAVVQTLAYLLACRIADYREYLAGLLEGKAVGSFQNDSPQRAPQNIGSLSVDEMFDILLATPLLHLIDGERPVECILVDGLDEAGSTENNELAAVLQKYSSRLPKWLRILVLSRNISAVQKWFGEARKINLTAEIRENREDLERFVRERLKKYEAESDALEKAIETIVSQSDGVFLYAKITVDALLDGKISLNEVQTFPRGLDQIYLRWFQWYVPDISTYDDKVRPAMNLMAASPEAMPEEEIIGVTGWRRKQLADFKRLMQVHLREGTNDSGEKTLDFNHLYVREWLVSPAASEYQIFVDDGILEMAEFFDEVISDEEPEISEFEARYVLTIMERAAALKRSMRRAYREAMRNEALMKRQEKLGRHCREWNRFYAAQEYLGCALRIAQCRTDDEDTAENRKHIVICKNRLARIEQSLGHGEAVKRLNEEALEVARQNVAERGWPEDLNRAAVSLLMIADYVDDQEEALRYYREAGELLEQAAATLEQGASEQGTPEVGQAEAGRANTSAKGTPEVGRAKGTPEVDDEDSDDEKAVRLKVDRNRSIVHNRMGRAALMRGDYAAAAASYFEDLKIAQRLAMETGKPEARRDFAVSCYKLAEVYRNFDDMEAAIYYYSLALRTMDILAGQRGQPEDIRGLIVLLSSRGNFMEWGGNQSSGALESGSGESRPSGALELLRSYERALALSREMVSKYGMAKDELFVADALANIGFVLKALGNGARAVESMREAVVIYAKYEPKKAENLKLWIEKCEV